MYEEKRRLENRLSTLEEDLEEEQMNSEAAQDKARKAMQQADSLTTEVSQLQSNLHKSESLNSQLEKQVGKLEGGGVMESVVIYSSVLAKLSTQARHFTMLHSWHGGSILLLFSNSLVSWIQQM